MGMEAPSAEEIFGKFSAWKLDEVTWIISFMNGTQFIYLLEGEDAALLVDNGWGVGHLRNFVERLTDKPILVTNTHFHPDHAAGNGEWEKVYLSKNWEKDAPTLSESPADPASFAYPDYEKVIIGDGYVFHLGGRDVEVYDALDAHCNSSLFFVDRGHHQILTGDEFECAQTNVFNYPEDEHAGEEIVRRISHMKENALKLKAMTDAHTLLLPAHNGTPISTAYLDDYAGLADAIYAGTAAIEDDLHHPYINMDPRAPRLCRVRYKNCSIFAFKEDILSIYGK